MPVQLKVRLEGADLLGATLGVLRRDLEARRRAAMHRALLLLKQEAQSRVHSPEGRVRRQIRYRIRGAGEGLRGILEPSTAGAVFSIRSTFPGRKMPPIRRIAAWLKRKGQIRSRSSAFLVARAIARRGTRGHPIMEATLEAKRGQVLAVFQEMLRNALRRR
jgi:hypothetical protein